MSWPTFKENYRGRNIYWHRGEGYGDETIPYAATMAEARAKIDAALASVKPSDADIYWSALTTDERQRWRKLCQTTELSASELAYTNRSLPR